MTLTIGKTYRFTDANHSFRVFLVAPNEDLAIVASIGCSSTRLRQSSLGALNEGLATGLIELIPDPYKPALPAEVRGAAAQKSFERIRPALEELWSLGVFELSRRRIWPDIARLARQAGVTASTLNKAFSDVVQAGGVLEAAIPRWDKCGRKPSTGKADYRNRATDQPSSFPLGDMDYKKIAAGVRKFLRGGRSWEEAYDLFLEEFYSSGETEIADRKVKVPRPVAERPSLAQFKCHGMELVPLRERLQLQFGNRVVQTDHRGAPIGQSAPALYPGFVGEIDWTILDNVGVARGSRLSVGRLIVYAVADAHCGAVLSGYATLFSGSVKEAGAALVQCLEDKVDLCARYGLTISRDQWDMQSLPVELRCDKGEINSWKATGLGTALGMKLEYCPSRRPDMKGTVESFLRILGYLMRQLRGGTSGMRERLKDHPNVTAIYDFDQLQRLIFTLIVRFNARVRRRQAMTPGMVATRTLPTPNELYRWAKERGCMRQLPLRVARLGALPTHEARVTPQGITIMGLNYMVPEFDPSSTAGIEANDWLMRARRQRWAVEVGVDPATVDFVWLRHRPSTGEPMELQCPLSPRHDGWRGLSWMEYGLNSEEYKQSIRRYVDTNLRYVRSWARSVLATTTEEALAMTQPKRANMSGAQQIEGAAERRKDEMHPQHAYEPYTEPEDGFFNEAQWRNS